MIARRRADALAVFAVALGVRLGVVAWAHTRFPAVEDGRYFDVLARRLAGGQGYTWLWPDGAVTYAAHYPVGYPAMLAAAYAIFGASGGVAMCVNALVGASSAFAAHRLVDGPDVARWRPAAAGLAVALHPALVPYTAAVMTEGVTAALLVIAAALASAALRSQRAWAWIAAAGIAMGLATLVRPQSIALAPVLGALAAPSPGVRGRAIAALVATAAALACVAPWTARNCVRMHRCALVSVNGGWNLLIGAEPRSGAWEPLDVPAECAGVWDEAEKDSCFGRAAERTIAASPGAWAARVPRKLAATFDYFGAAPWYLHASNAAALDPRDKVRLGAVETVAARIFLLGALVACARSTGGRRRLARALVAAVGAVAALFTVHAWVGYVAIVACVALLGRSAWRAPLAVSWCAAVVAATAVVHAVFFGAGRYGLVVAPMVAIVAASAAFRSRDADPAARVQIA